MAENALYQPRIDGEMRATQPRNALLGLLADALYAADKYAQRPNPSMPMGKANPPLSLLSSALGLGDIAATADRYNMRQDLTRGTGWATQMLPETANTLLSVGPAVVKYPKRAAAVTAGLLSGGGDMTAARASAWLQNMLVRPTAEGAQMTKEELIAQVRAALSQTDGRHIGLRILPEEQAALAPGDVAPSSFKWVNGDITSKTLPGASAASLGKGTDAEIENAIRNLGVFESGPNGYYFGPKIALVSGTASRKGEDVGESVIKDAVVKWVADNPRWKK